VSDRPLISAVVPAYNCGDLVSGAIESILNQTYEPIEVIAIDDGSTDETPRVLESYGDAIRFVRQPNSGPARARNHGVSLSRGEFIAFCDADDLWLPEKTAEQMAYFRDHQGCHLVYADLKVRAVTGEVLYESYFSQYPRAGVEPIFESLLSGCFILTSTVLVRSGTVRSVGGFDEQFWSGQDLDLWLRIARSFEVGQVNKVLAVKREHPTNISASGDRALESRRRVFLKAERQMAPDASHAARSTASHMIGRLSHYIGVHRLRRGELAEARAAFAESMHRRYEWLKSFRLWLMTHLPVKLVAWLRQARRSRSEKAQRTENR
jgi:glycosyltransferase involved in cell wall biosynthesis